MPTSTSSPRPPTSPVSARSASGSHQRDGRPPGDHTVTEAPVVAHTLPDRPEAAHGGRRYPETRQATTPSTEQPSPQPDPFDTSHLGAANSLRPRLTSRSVARNPHLPTVSAPTSRTAPAYHLFG